jgi:type I restriction enzyme S subunit
MNAERLLQHFDRISEAPDAIPRLRRFILDLAVRGKLVEQDPSDEPASELLKRIHGEKSRLIKKQKEAAEMDGTGVSLEVPPNWKLIPLIALGTWAIGSGFPKNEQGIQDGPYFFLKVSDMNLPGNEKYIVSSQNFIDEAAAARMRAKIHPPGTIIFPKIGGAIATNKRRILTQGSAIDNNCLGITFWSNLSVDWCYLLLTTLDFTQYQAGTAVPALQQSVLEQIRVSLPPLAEQHRIVAKVDELMSLCDQLEAAKTEREQSRDRLVATCLHHLNQPAETAEADAPDTFCDHAQFIFNHLPRLTTRRAHIKQLRETILNLAVCGKLVPQNPNDEPALELLKRIQAEKARLVEEGIILRQKWASSDLNGYAFERPVKWEAVNFGDVCNLVTSGSRGWAEFYSDAGPKFIRAQNIRFGRLRLDDLACVNPPKKTEGTRTQVSNGDLLIVIGTTGAGVTNPALLERELGEAYVSQHVALIKPTATSLSRWLLLCLMAPAGGRAELVERAYGAGKPGLNLDNIRSLNIPLPPLAEQHRIVAKVDELMALCDQLEAQLTTTEADSRRLLEAVLHEALNPPLEVTEPLGWERLQVGQMSRKIDLLHLGSGRG